MLPQGRRRRGGDFRTPQVGRESATTHRRSLFGGVQAVAYSFGCRRFLHSFGQAILLHDQQQNLRQILTTDRKRKIHKQSKERYANDNQHPQPLLTLAETLRFDADHRAKQEDQPNEEQEKKDLRVELRGFETKSFDGFGHVVGDVIIDCVGSQAEKKRLMPEERAEKSKIPMTSGWKIIRGGARNDKEILIASGSWR